jgi:hypothetical protein
MFWIVCASLAALLLLAMLALRLGFLIEARLRQLLRSASEIQALLGQLRVQPMPAAMKRVAPREESATKQKSSTASCTCQHCGKEFLFYIEGYSEEKSFGRCPGCGRLTKLHLPGQLKLAESKPKQFCFCGTCGTRIPFRKGEEWTKTTCPVCGSETVLQPETPELKS